MAYCYARTAQQRDATHDTPLLPSQPRCNALHRLVPQVISHLYELHGEGVAAMLDGFFAFTVLDTRTNTFYVARDPIGVTCLYIGWGRDGSVWLSSEMKCLKVRCRRRAERHWMWMGVWVGGAGKCSRATHVTWLETNSAAHSGGCSAPPRACVGRPGLGGQEGKGCPRIPTNGKNGCPPPLSRARPRCRRPIQPNLQPPTANSQPPTANPHTQDDCTRFQQFPPGHYYSSKTGEFTRYYNPK